MRRQAIRASDGSAQFRGMRRQMLTHRQICVVRKAWADGETQSEIAARIGVSVDTIRARLKDQLSDLPARNRGRLSRRRGVDPTEEEIYGRLVLAVQASWTDEERELRWRGGVFKRTACKG